MNHQSLSITPHGWCALNPFYRPGYQRSTTLLHNLSSIGRIVTKTYRTFIPKCGTTEPSDAQRYNSKLIAIARADYGKLEEEEDSIFEIFEQIATGKRSIFDSRIDPKCTVEDHQSSRAFLQRCISKLYGFIHGELEDKWLTLSECAQHLLDNLDLRTGSNINAKLRMMTTSGPLELGSMLKCTVDLCNSHLYDHRLIGTYLQSECFENWGARVLDSLSNGSIVIDWSNEVTNGCVAEYLVSLLIGRRNDDTVELNRSYRWWNDKTATQFWQRVSPLIIRDPMVEHDRALLLLQTAELRKFPMSEHSAQVVWLARTLIPFVEPSKFPFDSHLHDRIKYNDRRQRIRKRLVDIVLANTRLCKNLSSLIVGYLYDV